MNGIEMRQIVKRYEGHPVLDGVNLSVSPGEFLVILGASGGGKTTLLNLIAGLAFPDSGSIRFAGEDVTRYSPGRRNVAFVFQDYALYPHLTVEKNIRFPLENLKVARKEMAIKVDETLERLHLESVRRKLPHQLSGGQKQRTAIGRALVRNPSVFLFDEPLSNLDPQLRDHLRAELKQLHRELQKIFIYVTHDPISAMVLGDRVAFLSSGNFRQVGTPEELYHRPALLEVARSMGYPPVNILDRESWLSVFPGPVPDSARQVGIRPEDWIAVEDPRGLFEVDWIQSVGYAQFVSVGVLGGTLWASVEKGTAVRVGTRVNLKLSGESPMLFDGSGDALPADREGDQ